MMRSNIGRVICFFLLMTASASRLRADEGAKSAEAIFKAKGLVQSGFLLVLPEEEPLHETVEALHVAKRKLAMQAARIKDADSQIKAAESAVKSNEDDLRATDQRMASGQRDNASIDRHNYLLDEIKDKTAKIKGMTQERDKLMVSRSDYITAVLDAAAKIDAVARAYDAPRQDKELAAVIEKYNLTAKPRVKLGPSAYFTEDLAFVNQCKADVSTGLIPITTESGVPNVDVLINGKPIHMIWDSGCTGITLSAKTARTLGLQPSSDDEMERAIIADGSQVSEHVKILDSIRIGAFTVKHVRCTIPSGSAAGTDLLGNEFQHLFQFKLDINNKTLQLSPLDSQAVTVEAASKSSAGSGAAAGLAPPAAAGPSNATAEDPTARAGAPEGPEARTARTILLRYSDGDTELATLKEGVKYFSDRDYPLQSLAGELTGLTFTRRDANTPSHLDIFVPPGATVYLLVDSDKSGVHDTAGLNNALLKQDWTRLDDAECMIRGKHPFIAVYKRTENAGGRHYILSPATWAGIVVAAKNLKVTPAGGAVPGDDSAPSGKPTAKNSANALAGAWFEPSTGSNTTLNADGSAKSTSGVKGAWTGNADGSEIQIKWTDGSSDIYRLRGGKWTRYGYSGGKLQTTDEISPP